MVSRPSSLDHFLSRLFGELFSQPGYGFHGNYDAGEITANLIESVRKFRQVMTVPLTPGLRPPPLPSPEAHFSQERGEGAGGAG